MKMRCAHARAIVSDYINSDLDAERAALLEAHLRECQYCPPLYAALVAVQARVMNLARGDSSQERETVEKVRRALGL